MPSEADLEQARKIVASSVLPGWARRCGADCATEWNERIGKVIGQTMALK